MATWQKVFDSDNAIRAEIVKDILNEKNIQALIINKKDSSYNSFGQYEVMVQANDVLRSIKIINDEIVFE